MDHSTFERLIYRSSRGNWIKNLYKDILTFKLDLNISIRAAEAQDNEDRKFEESWHLNLPDATAYKRVYDLYYGFSHIQSETIVYVDGGRAGIPLPDRSDTSISITRNQYNFGKIIDQSGTLDDYINRLGIQVMS